MIIVIVAQRQAYTLYDTALFLLNMNARNTAAISRPGCWAMAGMLMVGVDSTHGRWLAKNSAVMNRTEMEVQFGGECILSSPLILSFDPTNSTAIDRVWREFVTLPEYFFVQLLILCCSNGRILLWLLLLLLLLSLLLRSC
jgi:hypothetical protein